MTKPWGKKGIVGRADLVRLGDHRDDLAQRLGYHKIEVTKKDLPPTELSSKDVTISGPHNISKIKDGPLQDVGYWYPATYEAVEAMEKAITQSATYPDPSERDTTSARLQLLTTWRELNVRLHDTLVQEGIGRRLDVERIIKRVSEGEVLEKLPRKHMPRWPENLQLVFDRSRRLIPFFEDQVYVGRHIRTVIPRVGFEPIVYDEQTGGLGPLIAKRQGQEYPWPAKGTTVLVLGDLGCLGAGRYSSEFWLDYGKKLRSKGCRPIVLFPGNEERCPPALKEVWTLVAWENRQSFSLKGTAQERLIRLIRLLSIASRIEPGLVRAMRKILPANEADASTEADVWDHPLLVSKSAAAATLDPEKQKELRESFEDDEEPEYKKKAVQALKAWRGDLPEDIWHEEVLNLDETCRVSILEDVKRAQAYFCAFAAEQEGLERSTIAGSDLLWLSRMRKGMTEHFWKDSKCGEAMVKLDVRLNAGYQKGYQPPPGFEPKMIEAKPEAREKKLHLFQVANELKFLETTENSTGLPIGTIHSKNDTIDVQFGNDPNHFWHSGKPPIWAQDWGTDEYGSFVDFQLNNITQRMRWIPSGQFMMGSPDDEPWRYDDESPIHEVTIASGFWLFDTPVTQSLWQEVMGENPSHFKSPERPVEQVSWQNAQKFISNLSQRIAGLNLSLPSEAQWEYACRGGTNNPQTDIKESAWYGGNSAENFELEGESGTHPVGQKLANAYGLYDMLGNVDEWCEDDWHDSYEGASNDGKAWKAKAAGGRVVRGGSWDDDAQNVRAACRFRYTPQHWSSSLGFRCACVHVSQAGEETARPARALKRREAERRLLSAQQSCTLPEKRSFSVITDRDHLNFEYSTKPGWASAVGRDQYGLWSEFNLGKKQDKTLVQRLRWIPPSRFMMGSRENDREGPVHEVTIASGFWLFDTPVTQKLWHEVMGENPSEFKSPERPVEKVSWLDAQKFISSLSQRIAGLNLSLPSEAQWEYACRGGTNKPPTDLKEIAWYSENSMDDYELQGESGTHPVGQKRANAYGLYDMLGNVWEWCEDDWHRSYDDAPNDGSAWKAKGAAGFRVVRGGSWSVDAQSVRAAYRLGGTPEGRDGSLGLRCACVQK